MTSRQQFDVQNKNHVERYRQFLINRKWGTQGCPFELEYPFDNIPTMIDNKLIKHFLNIKE